MLSPNILDIGYRIVVVSAISWGIIGCSTPVPSADPSKPESPTEQVIKVGQRALPTLASNATQRAHYQHVFLDTSAPSAGSLVTISLTDAVESNVLASSELEVKPLDSISAKALRWMVLEAGHHRPDSLEAIAGAGAVPNNFREVNFDVNSTEVLNRNALDSLLKLSSRASGIFYVVGYADETGIEAGNLALSKDRAESVAAILKEGGVNPTRIQTAGAGVSRTYNTLEANRRASVTLRIVD